MVKIFAKKYHLRHKQKYETRQKVTDKIFLVQKNDTRGKMTLNLFH